MEKQKDETLLINRKEVSDLLGVSPTTFDECYRYKTDFPKEQPGKKWSRLAVRKWDEKNSK
ncbi:MAG: hypothetical protein LKF43_00385 [Streptococcaceae bacterium]|jgi:predicted DNA-binding transcriptional regulator AlpA|nr:hypothetical protein [Streptococcaceae bacterium]